MDFLSPSVYHSQLVLWGKSLGCTTVFLSVHTVVLAKQNLPKLTEICTDWAVEVCDVSEKKIICCDREVLLLFACSQLSWGTNCGTLAATQEDPGRCVQVFVVPPPPAAPGLPIKRGRMHDWGKCRTFADVLNNWDLRPAAPSCSGRKWTAHCINSCFTDLYFFFVCHTAEPHACLSVLGLR